MLDASREGPDDPPILADGYGRRLSVTIWLALPRGWIGIGLFDLSKPGMQNMVHHNWIPLLHVEYFLGVDGISLPLRV